MPKIMRLSPHVADLIAAGEVVERPASVIKELLENSIDAGALSVTVEIKNGGMTFMRVTDNGCGIAADDAELAFLRYATSKLRDARGLEAISTLGFRGEALAAISSVSKIELITKEADADTGVRLLIEGGELIEKAETGCPDGTTFIVRDLFFNTPARLKFIKSDKAEGSGISSVVLRSALSHPEVSVRYIKDGKEEFHTAGDGRIDSCLYTLFGRDFASGMLRAESDDGKVKVKGFVSAPSNSRGNRSYQFFFLNGRYIKSKALQAALEQAYKNSLFTGRFPSCILHLEISPAAVDVNVHPTKIEVKFLNEREVFSAVYHTVLSALEAGDKKAEVILSKSTKSVISSAPVLEKAEKPAEYVPTPRSAPVNYGREPIKQESRPSFSGSGFKTSVKPFDTGRREAEVFLKSDVIPVYQTKMDMPQEAPAIVPPPPAVEAERIDFTVMGEVFATYIIAEQGEKIFFIDKHAAHERIIFDRLKAENSEIMPQLLLTPVVCDASLEDRALIEEHRELLLSLGFEIEEFGGGSIVIRQLPSDIDTGNVPALIGELCEKLRRGSIEDVSSMRDEILHTIACKAAIKAGTKSQPGEVYNLVKRVLSGEVKYCPHGRPVVTELTKAALDKNFRRI